MESTHNFRLIGPLMARTMGAFHSTKYSGLKFRVFHVTNGTEFSGWLDQAVPGHHVSSFARNCEIDKEKPSAVLGENDDIYIMLFSVASSYMPRNLNGVRDNLDLEGTIYIFIFLTSSSVTLE